MADVKQNVSQEWSAENIFNVNAHVVVSFESIWQGYAAKQLSNLGCPLLISAVL